MLICSGEVVCWTVIRVSLFGSSASPDCELECVRVSPCKGLWLRELERVVKAGAEACFITGHAG